MNSIILCLSLFLTPHPKIYPIDPRPLRMLVEESEYIIIGYVQKTANYLPEKGDWNNTKATIEVREVLQGKIVEGVLVVPFLLGVNCPATPSYTEGTLVLAFLDKEKEVYSTHALSYGEKTLKIEEIQIYKLRIKELQKIQRVTDEKARFAQTVDWLVKCAENPVTRWEGTFDLSPQSDFMSFYKTSELQEFSSHLNKWQKERLKNALFADSDHEQLSYVDIGLVDLIYDTYSEEIDKLLIENLKNIFGDSLWFVESYMNILMHKTDNPRALEIKEGFNKIYFEDYGFDDSPEKALIYRNLIDEFLALIE